MSEDVTKSGQQTKVLKMSVQKPEDHQELNKMSLHEHPYNEIEKKFGEGDRTGL